MNFLRRVNHFRWVRVLAVVIVVLSLGALMFHHHDDPFETHDCPACRLIQAFVTVAILLVMGVIARVSWPLIRSVSFESSRLAFSFQNRAPPFLS